MDWTSICECVACSHACLNSGWEANMTELQILCASLHKKMSVCTCVYLFLCSCVIQQWLRSVRRVGAPAHLISSLQGSLAVLHHCAEHDVRVLDHQPLHCLLVHLKSTHKDTKFQHYEHLGENKFNNGYYLSFSFFSAHFHWMWILRLSILSICSSCWYQL